MRNFGGILLLLGILGFFYASAQQSDLGPVPEGLNATETAKNAAARWEIVRYGCAGAGVVGLLIALFPRGR